MLGALFADGALLQQGCPAKNRVQRRAQFMRERGDEFVLDAARFGMRRTLLQQPRPFALRQFALSDVTNRAGYQLALGADRTEADFDGKLGAVLSASEQLESGAHRAGVSALEVRGPMPHVSRTVPIRNQDLDAFPEELVSTIA